MDTPTPAPSKCLYCGGIWADCDCMHPETVAPAPAVSGQTPTGFRELVAALVVQLRTDAADMTDFSKEWLGEESKIYGSAKASGYRYIATRLETILASSAPVASAPKDDGTITTEGADNLRAIANQFLESATIARRERDNWKEKAELAQAHSRSLLAIIQSTPERHIFRQIETELRAKGHRVADIDAFTYAKELFEWADRLNAAFDDAQASLVADSAEILSSERSTPARPRDPVTSSADSSSVPSARTVTRYHVGFDVEMMLNYLQPIDGGKRKANFGEVVLFEDVEPLLTTLAEANNARAQLQQVVSDKSVEIKDLRALLAERAQEIERLKGAAESDAEEYIKAVQVVGEMTEQIHALTARAEAAEAALKELAG